MPFSSFYLEKKKVLLFFPTGFYCFVEMMAAFDRTWSRLDRVPEGNWPTGSGLSGINWLLIGLGRPTAAGRSGPLRGGRAASVRPFRSSKRCKCPTSVFFFFSFVWLVLDCFVLFLTRGRGTDLGSSHRVQQQQQQQQQQ